MTKKLRIVEPCPICKSKENVVKLGITYTGKQRFACKTCNKSYYESSDSKLSKDIEKILLEMGEDVIDEFIGSSFKIIRKNNELVIETDKRSLYADEQLIFMKFFDFGTLNVKGKDYTIVNGEIFQIGEDGEIYKKEESPNIKKIIQCGRCNNDTNLYIHGEKIVYEDGEIGYKCDKCGTIETDPSTIYQAYLNTIKEQ